ncbi:MAG: hypothetical protein Q9168_000386 [Polycauliona sp. 1 TL-2023]
MAVPNMQLAEHLWMQHASNLNHGYASNVTLNPAVERAIGSDGLALIAERYESMIQAPVEIKKRNGLPTTIYPKQNLNGHEKVTVTNPKSKMTSKKDKVARPPNAFILYRQHHHPIVKSQNADLHNNQISIMLGKQWQDEAADVKAEYKALAEKIKKEHLNAHPNYQYQPRKPAEKKRRMTRRKADKLNAQADSSNDPINAANVPVFEKTSNGNAVFTLGDRSIKDDGTLLAMIQKHNEDLVAHTTHYDQAAAPVLYHERSEESQNEVAFYSNMLNFEKMYPSKYGPNELLPEDAAMLDIIRHIPDSVHELIFDYNSELRQNAQLNRMLSHFSPLWNSPPSDQENPSFESTL